MLQENGENVEEIEETVEGKRQNGGRLCDSNNNVADQNDGLECI